MATFSCFFFILWLVYPKRLRHRTEFYTSFVHILQKNNCSTKISAARFAKLFCWVTPSHPLFVTSLFLIYERGVGLYCRWHHILVSRTTTRYVRLSFSSVLVRADPGGGVSLPTFCCSFRRTICIGITVEIELTFFLFHYSYYKFST